MKHLVKKSAKTGLPPGTLVHVGARTMENTSITLFEYDDKTFFRKDQISVEECIGYLKTPTKTWVNISGLHDVAAIEKIGKHFNLHPLIQEDIVNSTQRAKLDDFNDNLFLVMRYLKLDKSTIVDEQVSLILGNNYVISFLESDISLFNPLIRHMQGPNSRLCTFGSDYLFYSMLDLLVDQYFAVLESIDPELENLDKELIRKPRPNTLVKIQMMKRELALLKKAIWPLREVISKLNRIENPLITSTTKIYLEDVYDHTIQTIDAIESFREVSSSQLDLYMSSISQRLNEVMKVLTIVSTIFVPMTFIASFYGMNFVNMPELNWQYGVFYAIGLMTFVTVTMLAYFKRKGWIFSKT